MERVGELEQERQRRKESLPQAEERGEILELQDQLHQLDEKIRALYDERRPIKDKLNTYKKKCPTCRCKILPGKTCECCAGIIEIDDP